MENQKKDTGNLSSVNLDEYKYSTFYKNREFNPLKVKHPKAFYTTIMDIRQIKDEEKK